MAKVRAVGGHCYCNTAAAAHALWEQRKLLGATGSGMMYKTFPIGIAVSALSPGDGDITNEGNVAFHRADGGAQK